MTAPTITVRLRPVGRGNWAPLRVTLEGKHAPMLGGMVAGSRLGLAKGQRFELGGLLWRVVDVVENRAP